MHPKEIQRVCPPASIGIIGGGQLGKMLAACAKRWGYRVVIYDPNPNAPAGQSVDEHICASYLDHDQLRNFAKRVDVITYEVEHLPMQMFDSLQEVHERIVPSVSTLKIIQDKYLQKQHFRQHHLAVAEDAQVASVEEIKQFFDDHHDGCILKARMGGYDGKGTYAIQKKDEIEVAFDAFKGQAVYIEALVPFVKEVSVMVVKQAHEVLAYPIAENKHELGILISSSVPAQLSKQVAKKVEETAIKAIQTFETDGLFCVEFFITASGHVLINEVAPRAHNSGHYTIEACTTSQFEQWLRIMLGIPLGSIHLKSPAAMVNVLGPPSVNGHYHLKGLENIMAIEGISFYLYGKDHTSNRKKLGHITACADHVEEANELANQALMALKIISNHGELKGA